MRKPGKVYWSMGIRTISKIMRLAETLDVHDIDYLAASLYSLREKKQTERLTVTPAEPPQLTQQELDILMGDDDIESDHPLDQLT